MFKRILGLDISSSTIGWALLGWDDETNEITFIKADFYKPSKDGDIFERLTQTKKDIQLLFHEYRPDYIGIEEIIQFMGAGSSAHTIITLATYNRTIGLLSYDYLGQAPELFSVMKIRHGLKLGYKLPTKEEMPKLLRKHLKIKLPDIMSKTNKIKPETYDRADGLAVALYYAFKLSGRTKK